MKNVNFKLINARFANTFGVTRENIQEGANAVENGATTSEACKIIFGKVVKVENLNNHEIKRLMGALNFYTAIGIQKKKKVFGKRIGGKLFS